MKFTNCTFHLYGFPSSTSFQDFSVFMQNLMGSTVVDCKPMIGTLEMTDTPGRFQCEACRKFSTSYEEHFKECHKGMKWDIGKKKHFLIQKLLQHGSNNMDGLSISIMMSKVYPKYPNASGNDGHVVIHVPTREVYVDVQPRNFTLAGVLAPS